jgi:hypothetical protein
MIDWIKRKLGKTTSSIEKKERMDFQLTYNQISELTSKGQATFCYGLVGMLDVGMVKTLHNYAVKRLENDKSSKLGQRHNHLRGDNSQEDRNTG